MHDVGFCKRTDADADIEVESRELVESSVPDRVGVVVCISVRENVKLGDALRKASDAQKGTKQQNMNRDSLAKRRRRICQNMST